ncbi:kelch-like protein 10 [Girardinichthys multiradiatus]|uniref:kelch-like protein 10 n=1 Tax=Girardinichthys multiradiatus TaxID=208333 RepID=UPI001FAC78F5|nr:kelch-like protein 10 [Girardinichthys multiradiatus]
MNDKVQHSDLQSSVYNQLRLAGKLTDAVIVAEGVEFQVHKIILCNCIPYFCDLFTQWCSLDQEVFHIPGISAEIMQLILEYVYTNSLTVTESNAQELLLAANQLNASEVVHACCIFLEGLISPNNFIAIWRYTTTVCPLPMLHFKIYCYILQHFEEVALSDEFLQLSAEEFAHIIEADNLIVRNESTVFEAVMRWTSHAPEERETHLATLLSKVRLRLLDADYFRDHFLPNVLVEGQSYSVFCDVARTITEMVTNKPHLAGKRNTVGRPRLPTGILLAIGGWSGGNPINGIEAYDVRADCWINITNNTERPRAYHGTAFLNGYVYCIGGFDRLEHFSNVRRFDPITGNWHEVAPMYYQRCYVSVTVLNGCIYAMGGYDGHMRLSTAEYYRPEINQWSLIAPMHEQRSDASCTSLNNKIYICGGFNGHDCLQTAEYYSPETNQWTMITPMNSRRSGIGVMAYAGHVYAVGGFDGNSRLSSAEAYNPDTNLWTNVASMITTRSNFGIEVVEDRLFVVGGFNGFTTSYAVECYDATTNEWFMVCGIGIFRSALSCCVISGIPNMADYVVPRDTLPQLPAMEEEEEEEQNEMESGDSLNE